MDAEIVAIGGSADPGASCNSLYLTAGRLTGRRGHQVRRGDVAIVSRAGPRSMARSALVIITGGLSPTGDDGDPQAVAMALDAG